MGIWLDNNKFFQIRKSDQVKLNSVIEDHVFFNRMEKNGGYTMNITVIGASNGGKAVAADMSLAGHDVTLFEFPQFIENLVEVKKAGGINLVGEGRKGFARLHAITDDIQGALKSPDIIINVMSAFGHKVSAKACAPYLKDGQIIVLNPGSTLGSLEYRQVLKAEGVTAKIKIGDLHTLTYAARGSGAEVRILLEVKKLWLSAFPARDTPEVLSRFKQLYPVTEAGKNILDVGLNNGNPIAHPGPAILNAGRVEYAHGEFYHYKEGITPHVANVIQALDDDRQALCRKMGFPVIPTTERMRLMGYATTDSSLYEAYNTSPVFCGEHPIKGPHSVMDRYFVEDTMYGLVTWSSLGRSIDVSTPTIDAVIQLISALHQTNYFDKGERSLEEFGLSGLNAKELNDFFDMGSL
jgi:opine dehydrogenase